LATGSIHQETEFRTSGFVKSLTGEILVHFAVLIVVLLPILTVVFPGFLILLAASMINGGLVEGSSASPYFFSCVSSTLIALFSIWFNFSKPPAGRLTLRQLSGQDGETLLNLVAQIWSKIGKGAPTPNIRWFPAMDIAAYVGHSKGIYELQISAGLWRSAVSGQAVAHAILAHELAHLAFRDPIFLSILKKIAAAIRGVTVVTSVFAIVALIFLIANKAVQIIDDGSSFSPIFAYAVRLIAAAFGTLVLLPLGWLAMRRQIAYITSLIEIRADVAGAVWTIGLSNFTQAFVSSKSVVRSSGRKLMDALFSPTFSHIPERERLAILSTSGLIITPKLRFFGFSLLLAFLLPISFVSPYLFGGAANYLAIQGLASALNLAIVVMAILGTMNGPVNITHVRLCIVATVSCVVTALPRINIEPISYFLMSSLLSFGGATSDWSNDFLITMADIGTMIKESLLCSGLLPAIFLTYLGLFLLCRKTKLSTSSHVLLRCVASGGIAVLLSFVAGLANRRPSPISSTEWIASTIGGTGMGLGLILGMPIFLAAVADKFLQVVSLKTFALR
jgi:hypothetical protein